MGDSALDSRELEGGAGGGGGGAGSLPDPGGGPPGGHALVAAGSYKHPATPAQGREALSPPSWAHIPAPHKQRIPPPPSHAHPAAAPGAPCPLMSRRHSPAVHRRARRSALGHRRASPRSRRHPPFTPSPGAAPRRTPHPHHPWGDTAISPSSPSTPRGCPTASPGPRRRSPASCWPPSGAHMCTPAHPPGRAPAPARPQGDAPRGSPAKRTVVTCAIAPSCLGWGTPLWSCPRLSLQPPVPSPVEVRRPGQLKVI